MFQIVNLGTKLSRARNFFWIGSETEEKLSAEKDIHFLAAVFDFPFHALTSKKAIRWRYKPTEEMSRK